MYIVSRRHQQSLNGKDLHMLRTTALEDNPASLIYKDPQWSGLGLSDLSPLTCPHWGLQSCWAHLRSLDSSPNPAPPCLCTPPPHVLDVLSPNSLSQSLISLQTSDRHHPDHHHPPPSARYNLHLLLCLLTSENHLAQSSTQPLPALCGADFYGIRMWASLLP